MAKLTTQRLHKVIQGKINVISSKVSLTQSIDSKTYDVISRLKKAYVVVSVQYIHDICDALRDVGITFEHSQVNKYAILVHKNQPEIS